MEAKPFLKWAGGKRQLLPILHAAAPKQYNHYFEPFIGGGAFFFSLRPAQATISDANLELITTYRVVRDDVEGLIRHLGRHVNAEDYYYAMRAVEPEDLSPLERASRFIYLNHTCFNGLHRTNKQGRFNTPFGHYKNPRICDPEGLRAASHALQGMNIHHRDYRATLSEARPGDFVYFDPPYVPMSATANFTAYGAASFGMWNQYALAKAFADLTRRGVHVMLSNANAPAVHKLYRGFEIREVHATRAISCKSDGRAAQANEVLVVGLPLL